MLKLKRPWGSEQAMDCTPEPVCPQPRIQFLDTPPVKKTRTALSFTSHQQQQQQQRESQFVATQSPNQEILENINHLLPKRSKRQETPTTTTTTTPFFNPFVPRDTPKEKVFTIEEVKELLDKALKEQEARLREEYDQILADRLQEQFSMFSRFNEDHISRQIQSSEYNYIS